MIWLIGNKGMLGHDVEYFLKEKNLKYIASDKEIDTTDYKNLNNFVRGKEIKWVINCSGYTNVDKAEEEKDKAFSINSTGVNNIIKVCKDKNATLIHISTDYVFDGKKYGDYTEKDIGNPLSTYGESKLKADKNIMSSMEKYFILRTSWLYGNHGKNFVDTMIRLFKEQDTVKVVSNQWGSPTSTIDLAEVIISIIKNNLNRYGIYNYTGEGKTNWFEFANIIYILSRRYNIVEREVKIVPIQDIDYKTLAKRPGNSYLSKLKINIDLSVITKTWYDSLDEYIKQKKNKL